MKIYNSRGRYSKFDHTEIKNLLFQMITELRKMGITYFDISSDADYYKEQNVDYDLDLVRSDTIKSKIVVEMFYCNNLYSWRGDEQYYLRFKDFKIKLGWYYHDDLWELWEESRKL